MLLALIIIIVAFFSNFCIDNTFFFTKIENLYQKKPSKINTMQVENFFVCKI
jgi:hypothetical protein